jgi:hypothetical protein
MIDGMESVTLSPPTTVRVTDETASGVQVTSSWSVEEAGDDPNR